MPLYCVDYSHSMLNKDFEETLATFRDSEITQAVKNLLADKNPDGSDLSAEEQSKGFKNREKLLSFFRTALANGDDIAITSYSQLPKAITTGIVIPTLLAELGLTPAEISKIHIEVSDLDYESFPGIRPSNFGKSGQMARARQHFETQGRIHDRTDILLIDDNKIHRNRAKQDGYQARTELPVIKPAPSLPSPDIDDINRINVGSEYLGPHAPILKDWITPPQTSAVKQSDINTLKLRYAICVLNIEALKGDLSKKIGEENAKYFRKQMEYINKLVATTMVSDDMREGILHKQLNSLEAWYNKLGYKTLNIQQLSDHPEEQLFTEKKPLSLQPSTAAGTYSVAVGSNSTIADNIPLPLDAIFLLNTEALKEDLSKNIGQENAKHFKKQMENINKLVATTTVSDSMKEGIISNQLKDLEAWCNKLEKKSNFKNFIKNLAKAAIHGIAYAVTHSPEEEKKFKKAKDKYQHINKKAFKEALRNIKADIRQAPQISKQAPLTQNLPQRKKASIKGLNP